VQHPHSRRQEPAADQVIAQLREEVKTLRGQLVELSQAVAAAQAPLFGGPSTALVEANGALVLSALHAAEVAESAMGELQELTRSGQHDVLTGTPNRALMLDRMEHAIALARRRGTRVALLFVDLDGFKQINDTLGHAIGDAVLHRVARRLESVIRDSDTVSRHGGDEFLVLLAEVGHATDAALIADKMLLAVAEPAIDCLPALSASVGIAIYPEDGQEAADLIANADAAMYRVKGRGRGGFAFHVDLALQGPGPVPGP